MDSKKKSFWDYLLELLHIRKKAGKHKPTEEVKPNRFFLNTIQVYVNVLSMKNKNEELAAELKELIDIINGSEAVSCASIEGIEEEIKAAFGELQKLVEQGRIQESKEACRSIRKLLEERNGICRELME